MSKADLHGLFPRDDTVGMHRQLCCAPLSFTRQIDLGGDLSGHKQHVVACSSFYFWFAITCTATCVVLSRFIYYHSLFRLEGM